MTALTVEFTGREIQAVAWAVALVSAVRQRAAASGRAAALAHTPDVPAATIAASLQAGRLPVAEAQALLDIVNAAWVMYGTVPEEIWATLQPPDRAVMKGALDRLARAVTAHGLQS